ncbi:unnamed protein product [Acanthoscelides obtectus]|uniref:15-hydroxyprostaglandin dehydrogenase [NAD(+)]-like n=2 Tax=Acanthoscelides obtectus TaxID=200917 RepID=A0A9P0MDM9_ACAOB|nr:unnamed protein product [Acanthoscelides obtectus]CAK1659012.1 15-hydroxyprostaglandin dehydrogenase [NAD(+)] [Acanthoscelides obtectus]
MVYDIKGKVALITGGAAGIGLAYGEELLKNGIEGLIVADVNEKQGNEAVEKFNKTYGPKKATFMKTDVTKKEQLEAAFQLAKSTYSKLDIVINNAGILNDAHWELEIAINCNAVVQGSLLGIQYMGKNNGNNGGIIVNIASILGLQKLEGCPIYVGTKHFVIGLNRSFGSPYFYDLTGIRFLTMCPGVTDTPLISDANKFTLNGFPGLGQNLAEGLGDLPPQPTTNVAIGLIKMIKDGENGSVWVSEGNQPIYEVEIPDRLTLRKK